MSIDKTKSFEEQIAQAQTPAEIREICINREVAQGTLAQDRDGTVRPVVQPVPAGPSAPSASAVRADPMRERIVYPYLNTRVVITGLSQEELDEAEARIRAAFTGQK